ncbi:hypothetical protein [Pinibacter soli]|uniref:Uncharacterized protein n=1 Tax=Pinibacter soli TaxID=3044211 RepID=A0ABT6RB35_9BACT|nr:hypothetical protein [Pinibacter soli]MDI3319777.1 hypothetical protein [Pinibacter soli]
MSIANTFPVFEADQVLTNKHLNDLFNYLDQQNRLTRCKLIGSGIVCGLEISHTNDTINITKGCGVTSQGYLILLCDHIGENGYKYCMSFTKPPFPADLEIISQCGDPNPGNVPFYARPDHAEEASNDILLLLTQTEYDALNDKTNAAALSQWANLSKYAVVLFLDADELKLKNCDTNDCNDKGSRMELDVKVLLVNKKLLAPGSNNGGDGKVTFSHLELRRYNVPVGNLNSSDDVLNAFVDIVTSDAILDTLAKDLNYCFITYGSLLSGVSNYSFGTGADFKKMLKLIQLSFPVYLQYFSDFIYDLIKAVYEFKYKAHYITSECCGDEMRFPFHLMLGDASANTGNAPSAYRQYFIYSPLFDEQGSGANELRSLLMRMILMHQNYLLKEKTIRRGLGQDIRITPSAYGRNFISERCIPYYYKTVHDSADVVAEDLYYYWSFDKTKNGNARWNLSYDPTPYNSSNVIANPLLYDIEWYNFFRIEGHIGKNINTALTDLISKKQRFNLPFDVIALSADYIGAFLSGDDPVCIIQDLESDYRIIIAEFICKLHDAFCNAGKNKFTPPVQVFEGGLFEDKVAAATEKKVAKKSAKKVAVEEADAVEPVAAAFERANIVIDHPFISSLVSEFQALAAYTKGDTLSRLCAPANGTVGKYYIDSVKANNGKYVNPAPNDANNSALFNFVDSVESMFQVLMTKDLPVLDTTAFKVLYSNFEMATTVLTDVMIAALKASSANDSSAITLRLEVLISNMQLILHTCIVEKLEALRNEYLRRVAQYRLAKNFNYYFKRHGGIEHKAGVPRAGTFILVYHEERRNRFVDVNSIFVNKELSNVLLTNFRELLQPDVDLDTQEAKAKLLAVTTLYKDPQLYLQFKNVMQEYLDNCNDLPPEKKNQISIIINRPPDNPTYQLTNGEVIADFYVPYMCCSDCLPVAYILPEAPAPDPLQVSQGDPVCDQEGKNYTVTLTVTDGTKPYSFTVNNTSSTNNQVTLPTGSADTVVTIKDSANQSVTATIKSHECQQPCNLPCKGMAENCKYYMWFAKPLDVLKDSIHHVTNAAKLTLTDENGADTVIDLKEIFVKIMNDVKITEHVYDDLLTKLFAEVNVKIKSAAPQFLENGKPMFSYDGNTVGNFQNQTINIERFICQNINLEINADITNVNYQRSARVRAIYDNKQVWITISSNDQQNFEFMVPKFGCVSLDKCAGKSVELCKDKLDIKELNMSREGDQLVFSTAPGSPTFDKYIWYFHFAKPFYSMQEKPGVIAQGSPVYVRVVGINSATGCYSIFEKTFNLNQ